jgi:hypothetical protein
MRLYRFGALRIAPLHLWHSDLCFASCARNTRGRGCPDNAAVSATERLTHVLPEKRIGLCRLAKPFPADSRTRRSLHLTERPGEERNGPHQPCLQSTLVEDVRHSPSAWEWRKYSPCRSGNGWPPRTRACGLHRENSPVPRKLFHQIQIPATPRPPPHTVRVCNAVG